MSGSFDPYRTWLGIPPEEQPPNHYRLLGIPPFEDQPEAIEHAADQRMAHLRTLQTGEHTALSQRLLNEVAAARISLLNPDKKAAYDAQLRQEGVGSLFPPTGLGHSEGASRKKTPDPLSARPRKPPVLAHAPSPAGGSPADQETAEWTGLRELGEYRLLEKVGHGGMGEVYKAAHTEMDRVVAVKVLPPGHLHNEHVVARFKREIKAVAQLKHPNVVEAYDAREIEGTRFLVMEYVEGMDLRDVAKRVGPLPLPEACELILQAALGLQCAHEHGLVHRDIKPSNLMLSRQGVVKLLDLGLARHQAEGPSDDEVTGTGEAMGTADYMAPEQAADSRSVDIRADLYSLGCTLYRLIAGQPPFTGPKYNTAVKKLVGHMQDAFPPITQFRAHVPKPLQIILGRLLAKDPAKRLHTPAELAESLAPLTVGSDLAGLCARATGNIPAPPPAQQVEVPTQSRESSGLTGFFDRIKRAAPEPAAHAPAIGRQKKTPAWLGYAAMGAVALLVVVAWGVWSANRQADQQPAEGDKRVARQSEPPGPEATPTKPRPTTGQLILPWPAGQRGDARLEIDDHRRDVSELAGPTDSQTLRVELKPGRHKVWIARRGFEPFEQTVTIEAGKSATVTPEWKSVPEVAVVPKPQPPEKPVEPKPDEKPKPPDVPVEKPKPEPEPPAPKIDPVIVAREQKWREAMEPVEKLAAAWDFAGAEAALEQVRLNEPALQDRLARRRDELKRMAALKAKMIARIKASLPGLKKSDLMLRGINGDVTGADDQAIHVKLSSGKTEDHPWAELNDKARPKLLQLAIDQTSPDDWLAGGLMAFVAGDVALAERLLDKARTLGTDIAPYLGLLAAGTYAEADKLLDEQKWSEANSRLEALQQKYGATPWFAESRPLVDAAIARAKTGIHQAEAEKLYAEAAKLFEANELFDLRDVIHKLKADYATTPAVTDTSRKPPFADLEKAVADLGTRLTVRQDGKGDFKTIQAAIDGAPPNSLIEIQDKGPYVEALKIPGGKAGLTLRGRRGIWPWITSTGLKYPVTDLVSAAAPRTRIESVVITHYNCAGRAHGLSISGAESQIRRCVIFSSGGDSGVWANNDVLLEECVVEHAQGMDFRVRDTIVFGAIGHHDRRPKAQNVLLLGRCLGGRGSEFTRCTITGEATFLTNGVVLRDSIVHSVKASGRDNTIEQCDVFGKPAFIDEARPGKGCFSAPPQFVDPKNFDYRLMPTSPCRGKASDGGDIGVRYTPQMIEMLTLALELRRRGIIKF